MKNIIPFVALMNLSLPAGVAAAPVVILLDASNSVDYTLEDADGREDMDGDYSIGNDRYPSRWDLMLFDLGATIDGVLPSTPHTFSVIPWNSQPYDAIPIWDTSQATAIYLANVVSGRKLPQGPTDLGQVLAPYRDEKVCEVLVVVTEDSPDDEVLVRDALYSILPEQPVAIFVLEYSKTADIVRRYRDLVQHPNLTVDVLTRENVLWFIQRTAGQIRPCITS